MPKRGGAMHVATALPSEAIELVRRTLQGETFTAAEALQITRSLPHGHVALLWRPA